MSDKQKNSVVGLGIVTVIFLIIFTHPNNKNLFKSGSVSEPFFPVQKEASTVSMQALLSGELKLEGRCLKVAENLIVWPQGFSVKTNGSKVNVLNNKSKIIASVGDSVKLSGGQITADEENSKSLSSFMNKDCNGPLWITAEVLDK